MCFELLLAGLVLFDFESGDEVAAAPSVFKTNVTVCVTNRFATSGRRSLAFHAVPWHEGLDAWPGFTMNVTQRDWTGYDRLVIDLVNDGPGGDEMMVYVAGSDGPMNRGVKATVFLPDHGHFRWTVPLDRWPSAVDRRDVARLHFFYIRPLNARLFMDRVMLLKPGEESPWICGEGVEKDILPLMHRGIALSQERESEARDEASQRDRYWKLRGECAAAGQPVKDFILAMASSMDIVRPRAAGSERLLPAERLSVRLARRETESIQLVVAPGDEDLRNVKLSVSSLTDARGECFPSGNVDCHVVGYVKVRHDVPYKVGADERKPGRGWWPEPILDFLGGVDVCDRGFQSFWLRVRCPESVCPGRYSGVVTVSADVGARTVRRELPFAVQVNGFTLPSDPPMPLAITFAPWVYFPHDDTSSRAAESASYRGSPQTPSIAWHACKETWFDFLAQYYLSTDSLYHESVLSDESIERMKGLDRQGRLGVFNLGYWLPIGEGGQKTEAEWRAKTLKRIVDSYAKVKAAGLERHCYVYGCDEATEDRFAAISNSVRIIKEELPDVPVITTAYDHQYGLDGSPLAGFDGYTPLTPRYDANRADRSRAAGHKVWWYIANTPYAPYANMFLECPGVSRRLLFGAMPAKFRPDGFLYYQTSIFNQPHCIMSGPFTDWDPRSYRDWNGDGCWFCAGPGGKPLPTQRLENFRDGLEDLAYVKLLRKKLSSNPNASWAEKARKLLAVPEKLVKSMTEYTDNPSLVLVWRNAMADILDLGR